MRATRAMRNLNHLPGHKKSLKKIRIPKVSTRTSLTNEDEMGDPKLTKSMKSLGAILHNLSLFTQMKMDVN